MPSLPNSRTDRLTRFVFALWVTVLTGLGVDTVGNLRGQEFPSAAEQPFHITHLACNTSSPMIALETFRKQSLSPGAQSGGGDW